MESLSFFGQFLRVSSISGSQCHESSIDWDCLGHSNHMGPLGKGQAQHSTSDTQILGFLVTPIQLI